MQRPDPKALGTALALCGALLAVAIVAYIPHLDLREEAYHTAAGPFRAAWEWSLGDREGYPYPQHRDELRLWADAVAIERRGTTAGPLEGAVHERGFEATLAYLHVLTGIEYESLVVHGPAVVSAALAFGLYALLRPHPAALVAAALFALFPTTPRFLGPALFVPVAFSLAWVLAAVLLAEESRDRPFLLALLSPVLGWAFFVHLMGGVAAVLAVGVLLADRARGGARAERFRLAAFLGLVAVASVVGRSILANELARTVDRSKTLPIDLTVLTEDLGWPALALAAAGLAFLLARPPREGRSAWVALGGLGVLSLLLILYTATFDPSRYATYDRWHQPFFLGAVALAAYGVVALAERVAAAVGRARGPRTARAAAGVVVLAALTATAGAALPHHAAVDYARPVDPDVRAAALWYKDGLGPEHETFFSQGTSALLAATYGERTQAGIWSFPTLREIALRDVRVVFDELPPPYFAEVHPRVFAIDPDVLAEVAEACRPQDRPAWCDARWEEELRGPLPPAPVPGADP